MNSANDIAVPSLPFMLPRDAPVADVKAIFQRLRQLQKFCSGPMNAEDRVTVLIAACITDGINTDARILGTLRRLGINPQRVGRVLHKGVGHNWSRAEDGQFSNLI